MLLIYSAISIGFFMEGVLILWELVFGGGHLEAGRNFFLLGCIFPWGYMGVVHVHFGGVAIFSS